MDLNGLPNIKRAVVYLFAPTPSASLSLPQPPEGIINLKIKITQELLYSSNNNNNSSVCSKSTYPLDKRSSCREDNGMGADAGHHIFQKRSQNATQSKSDYHK